MPNISEQELLAAIRETLAKRRSAEQARRDAMYAERARVQEDRGLLQRRDRLEGVRSVITDNRPLPGPDYEFPVMQVAPESLEEQRDRLLQEREMIRRQRLAALFGQ